MDNEFQAKQYFRETTGVPFTIKEVKQNEAKGQVVIVYEHDDGRLIDGNYAYDGEWKEFGQNTMKKIKTILGVESLMKDAIGKKIGLHINKGKDFIYKSGPKKGQKGVSYNIAGYFAVESLAGGPDGTSNLPF